MKPRSLLKQTSNCPFDPDSGASLTALNIDDPNLRSKVYKKTHYFFQKIKIFSFKIFLLAFFSNLRITSFAFCDLKKLKISHSHVEKLLCLLPCFFSFTRTHGGKMETTSRKTQCPIFLNTPALH